MTLLEHLRISLQRDQHPINWIQVSLDWTVAHIWESELQITPDPDAKIRSDFESDDQDFNQEKQENDDDGNSEQSLVPARLPYIKALESLCTHLGPKLCPEVVPDDPKSGASALDFFW